MVPGRRFKPGGLIVPARLTRPPARSARPGSVDSDCGTFSAGHPVRSMQEETFLWHDYETFGANPMADRPCQFAAQRTDWQLEPVDDPVVWYCAPANDVLPHPAACLITGITPQRARDKGIVEAEFAGRIHAEMMQAGTCSVGYNSIRFDDVFTRNLFYRNLRDPYEREYRNGNSRFDLIDLARMCYALRPAGVEWPLHEDGTPSFRLEDLSAANRIEHEGAHDALADVRATIGLARLIRTAQPRLFDWALSLRNQATAAGLLDTVEPRPVLHTSARIPAARGCTSLFLPLAIQPDRPKSVIAFDLSGNPSALIQEPADVIHDLVFTPSDDMPEGTERLPLKLIHTNQVPMLAPPATLRDADTARIGLDVDRCLAHARDILPRLGLIAPKVADIFSWPREHVEKSSDPDRMLYSGDFFSRADRHLMNKILDIAPADLGGHHWTFQDARLQRMLFRYRARNYPNTLSVRESQVWDKDRKHRLVETTDPDYFTLSDFRAVVAALRKDHENEPKALRILDQLDAWVLESGIAEL
jgi:exodeoxyribonuclease-1